MVIGYSISLLIASIFFYTFPNRLEYGKMNFLFFYSMTVYLLNSLFYFSLQQKIKKMTSPLFNSLSAICLMGGFAVGIFILLLLGISTIQPKMIIVFSPLFFILTIWTGRKYWLGKNWYERWYIAKHQYFQKLGSHSNILLDVILLHFNSGFDKHYRILYLFYTFVFQSAMVQTKRMIIYHQC